MILFNRFKSFITEVKRSRTFSTLLLDELRQRNLLSQCTRDELKGKFYIGFDPTASSLHIGNLLGLIVAGHLYRAGHEPVLLVGGATAMIGDPSFRYSPKNKLDQSTIHYNIGCIQSQLKNIMFRIISKFVSQPQEEVELKIVNNIVWYGEMNLLTFLDKVGRVSRLSSMLSKDSVQRRLSAATNEGMNFTEFTYQLMQGYDFYHLYQNYGCSIQLGGSDQWGNMVSGLELIDKLKGETDSNGDSTPSSAAVLTFPLLTTSDGVKMGKSEGNALWLDANLTSPYEFYQYFLRLPDQDALSLLEKLTFLSLKELADIRAEHLTHPDQRLAQRVLAAEVTDIVHGTEERRQCETVSKLLFEDYSTTALQDLSNYSLIIETFLKSNRVIKFDSPNVTLLNLISHQLSSKYSKRKLRTLAESGGVYLDGKRLSIEDLSLPIGTLPNMTDKGRALLRIGKHEHHLLDGPNQLKK